MSERDIVERLNAVAFDDEASAGPLRREAAAEITRLRAALNSPPAEMSYNGRLVPINSDGMREVVDEATRLRAELAKVESLRSDIPSLWWKEVRRCGALEAEVERLREEREGLHVEAERERLRLAACSVVTLADTPESSARCRADIHPDYRSAALADVERQVDELMRLRAEVAALRADKERLDWLESSLGELRFDGPDTPDWWVVDLGTEYSENMTVTRELVYRAQGVRAAIDAARGAKP